MKQRVDKILSNMGLCSRREAAAAAKSGQITVNSRVIRDSGEKVDPELDMIELKGKKVVYRQYTYLMLNKKAGYITATEDRHQPTVLDLLPEQERKLGLFAAGRLDKDAEGLLILTNDGAFAHRIMSPRHHIPKVYYAEIQGELLPDTEEQFRRGVVLSDGFVCLPAKIEYSPVSHTADITVCEGKFHQVKRMVQACGGEITYLKRKKIGTLELPENLQIGCFCKIKDTEIDKMNYILTHTRPDLDKI